MRLIYNDSVEEIFSICAIPGWMPENGTTENNPELYSVSIQEPMPCGTECRYVGAYNLDGTPETYQKARENFQKILNQIGEKGYVYMTQFENFTVY